MIARRTFLAGTGTVLLAAPLHAEAQQPGKVYRVAIIALYAPVSDLLTDPIGRQFLHGLRDLGYVEGRNLVLERRSLKGRLERLSEVLAEVVGLKVDVIMSANSWLTRAAKEATTSIPIVMVNNLTPVEAGLVASLARPGGNVTGLAWDAGPEVEGKRLELLKEVAPRISRVAWFGDRVAWDEDTSRKHVQAAARNLGIALFHAETQPPDLMPGFAAVTRERADAIFAASTPANSVYRRLIAEFAAKNRLPASYSNQENVEAGGLMSYGPSPAAAWRRAAWYVDKIFKGAKPADLPIEQPTKFELVINLTTAKALGLTIPPAVLGRADEVIQ